MILDVVRLKDCDAEGVPLDWEKCRTCGGHGKLRDVRTEPLLPCPRCGGHGSLKAAVLAALERTRLDNWSIFTPGPDFDATVRCRGCGHPAGDGSWDPGLSETQACAGDEAMFGYALIHLRGGGTMGSPHEPPGPVYWSPCDGGCFHTGPLRWRREDATETIVGATTAAHALLGRVDRDGTLVEASWRAVDVRSLDWPHDLRPESVDALCLRCWVART